MKIKQAKVGHPIKGMSSNILDNKEFNMEFKDHMLHVERIVKTSKDDKFLIFPANLAFIVPLDEEKEEVKAKVKK